LLLQNLSTPALLRLPLWLGGAIAVDDAVLAPIVVTTGWLLTRWCRDETAPDSPGHPALRRHHHTDLPAAADAAGHGIQLDGALPQATSGTDYCWRQRSSPSVGSSLSSGPPAADEQPTAVPADRRQAQPPYRLIVVKPNRRTG
jgi:hypothetical protein